VDTLSTRSVSPSSAREVRKLSACWDVRRSYATDHRTLSLTDLTAGGHTSIHGAVRALPGDFLYGEVVALQPVCMDESLLRVLVVSWLPTRCRRYLPARPKIPLRLRKYGSDAAEASFDRESRDVVRSVLHRQRIQFWVLARHCC
jgi:hypothetical protein